MSNNGIGDAGAVALADGIKVSTVLASFFVFGLPPPPRGNSTSFLFCAQPEKPDAPTAVFACMQTTSIGDAGAVALADGIKVSTVLASFFVFGLPPSPPVTPAHFCDFGAAE